MANHHGAYMLNEVLCALEEEAFFTTLGPERTQKFIKRIVNLGYGWRLSELRNPRSNWPTPWHLRHVQSPSGWAR